MTTDEAKEVLSRLNIRAVSSRNAAEDLIRDAEQALAAMIEEIERLTAPLDADEGRELVASAQWWFRDYDGTEAPDGAEPIRIPCCGELRRLLAYIERQAARIASLTAIPEDVERMAKNMDAMYHQWRRAGQPVLADECKEAAAALRAFAARESDRARVDEEDAHREDMANVGESLIEAIEDNRSHPLLKHWMPADGPAEIVADLLNAYDDRTAILDTANSVPPSGGSAKPTPDLAKLRREVEASTGNLLTKKEVLALIDREQEAGDA